MAWDGTYETGRLKHNARLVCGENNGWQWPNWILTGKRSENYTIQQRVKAQLIAVSMDAMIYGIALKAKNIEKPKA